MASLFGGLARAALGRPKSTGARLLERLGDATQLEDRREAISEFRDLCASEPIRLIDQGGMSVLVQLLRVEDTQITRDVLETLSNLFDPELPRELEKEDAAEIKAVHNASVFLTHDSNVSDLLGGAEDADLYVRFHAVQALMKLLGFARRQTQEAILNQPQCVGRLMHIIEDERDIVRNEVLLLLARIGEGNAGLQNILAFQGAFEQLLGIVEVEGREEGENSGSGSGGVIVHDCLRIIGSLLQGNASCCRFFRESGCLTRLSALLTLPLLKHTKGHATAVQLACELTSHLLSSAAVDAADTARADAAVAADADAARALLEAASKPHPDVIATQVTRLCP